MGGTNNSRGAKIECPPFKPFSQVFLIPITIFFFLIMILGADERQVCDTEPCEAVYGSGRDSSRKPTAWRQNADGVCCQYYCCEDDDYEFEHEHRRVLQVVGGGGGGISTSGTGTIVDTVPAGCVIFEPEFHEHSDYPGKKTAKSKCMCYKKDKRRLFGYGITISMSSSSVGRQLELVGWV